MTTKEYTILLVDKILKINGTKKLTDEIIEKCIDSTFQSPLFQDYDSEQARMELKNEMLKEYTTTQDLAQIIDADSNNELWLTEDRKNETDWYYWNRYKNYLSKHKSFPKKVIDNLENITDNILTRLYDPKSEQNADIKGLVVGHVQSGKTANYTGLICKAADTGYNLFIVLAGIHNSLRSQTQSRLEEGFLGFSTKKNTPQNEVGVGALPDENEIKIPSSYTTIDTDFDINALSRQFGINPNPIAPKLFVVKKNANILDALLKWLEDQKQRKLKNKKVLIIDDEADNASINNNKKEDDPTRINELIRKIIGVFKSSAYVGYTATPFANIFINPNEEDNDLFPKDFIVNIPTPSNYIGPETVFGKMSSNSNDTEDGNDDTLPIVHTITDHENYFPNGHKIDECDNYLKIEDSGELPIPESLKTAIKCFIVTCAIRLARHQTNKPNTMLIHVSRFQNWQNRIATIVDQLKEQYRRDIEQSDITTLQELKDIFEKDTPNYLSYKTTTRRILESPTFNEITFGIGNITWDKVKQHLVKVTNNMKVKAINGETGDFLDYEGTDQNKPIIAIGGDRLSRGLTLEGLSVSYFLRASKMYDTLMQMGRWFGYRLGYVDLCRLFMSSELNEWFRHISIASEELRNEFEFMADNNRTPREYALKVRTHPGNLMITSLTKLRNITTINTSWSGKIVETYRLLTTQESIDKNIQAVKSLVMSIGDYKDKTIFPNKDNHYIWEKVNSELVINFLNNYSNRENNNDADYLNLNSIREYISKINKKGELINWNVALINKNSAKKRFIIEKTNISAGLSLRNNATDSNSNGIYIIRKNRILGPSNEFIDFDTETFDAALKESTETQKSKNKTWTKNYPISAIARNKYRKTPLLIIVPLDPIGANPKNSDNETIEEQRLFSDDCKTPIFGFAIIFPAVEKDEQVTYAINNIPNNQIQETDSYEDEVIHG